ncbi:MAG: hypothetical protein WCB64_04490, partial [Desulfobaccales bacterium]
MRTLEGLVHRPEGGHLGPPLQPWEGKPRPYNPPLLVHRPKHRLEACATKGNGGQCPPYILLMRADTWGRPYSPTGSCGRYGYYGTGCAGLSGQIQGPVAEAQALQD